jgi:hypothetical protein
MIVEQENGFLSALGRKLQTSQFTERHGARPTQHGATG